MLNVLGVNGLWSSLVRRPRIVSQADLGSRLGIFADLFALADIKVLDVGARGGALDWTTFFAPFATYCACEPDPTARQPLKLAIQAKHPWRDVIIVPKALAAVRGQATLHITRHEGMSSLLKPNIETVREFGLEAEFALEREIAVEATTLSEAANEYGFENVCLIKADTQGTELEILQSGEDLLRGAVQAVFVEVEFRQFYQRQALFSELELYLRQFDFELISLETVTRRRASTQFRIGYSRREVVWAHAMFMKRSLDGAAIDEDLLFRRTSQQIAIAMAREQFDLAAERLSAARFQSALRRRDLKADADDLEAAVKRLYRGWAYQFLRMTSPLVMKHRRQSVFR